MTPIDRDVLDRIRGWLPAQRWYAGADVPAALEVLDHQQLDLGGRQVDWALLGDGSATYQVLLADGEDVATDPAVARDLLGLVTDGRESAAHARPMGVEQSNTSIVFDKHLVLKLYRRIAEGPNPDIELSTALHERGFEHVAAPQAVWRRGDRDLAVVQPFLTGAAEGWALALASVRDLYATRAEPEDAGGDFAGEACRLGELTAHMHLALAAALGTEDAGEEEKAIRVHGDYHLGQVVRADAGWFVLDFEGEPARPVEERRRRVSPLKDVAGMLRSFAYAPAVVSHELAAAGDTIDDELAALADAWEERNRRAFLEGYLRVDGIEAVLPPRATFDAALRRWELDKALYELEYERAYRPDWAHIPERAIQRLRAAG